MQNNIAQNTLSVKETVNFDETIRNYFSRNRVHLYILTPCFASLCYISYVNSLLGTINLLKEFNVSYTIEFCRNDSLVSRARNNLIARAMGNPATTHMLFIDNDITWSSVDILKLIMSDKQLVGGIYPIKKWNWDRLLPTDKSNVVDKWMESRKTHNVNSGASNEVYLQHKLLKYNLNHLANTISVDNNLTKIRHLATGFMLIKRDLIETMFRAYPATKYTDDVGFLRPEENAFAYALFDCGVEDDHYYSEDWLFCHRWTKIGGEVWADVSINLVHTGIEDFNGSFITSLLP